MGKAESSDIIFGILYASAAIMLFIVSYIYYLKRFKRNKLLAVNEVVLTTSRYDTYNGKTQFLIELSEPVKVSLKLLDLAEKEIETITEENMEAGENVVEFNPSHLQDGNYYLSLKTQGTSILRKINIENSKN